MYSEEQARLELEALRTLKFWVTTEEKTREELTSTIRDLEAGVDCLPITIVSDEEISAPLLSISVLPAGFAVECLCGDPTIDATWIGGGDEASRTKPTLHEAVEVVKAAIEANLNERLIKLEILQGILRQLPKPTNKNSEDS